MKDFKLSISNSIIKKEFRAFLTLFVALMLQMLLSLFVNLLDNFMLGRYMESAMSGASVVNQIHTLLANIIFGVGSGVTMLGAQYWGKGNVYAIKRLFACGLKTAFVIGLIFTIATMIFSDYILIILTNDNEVIRQGSEYLSVMCWTYLVYSISNTLMLSMQAVGTAVVGMIMSASTIIINFCLNYLLIYGNFGAPELGIKGAAYATLISRIVELIIVILYILFFDKKIKIRIRELFVWKTGYYRDYIKVAAPIMLTGSMWGTGLAAQTAIIGHLSSQAIGASSIAGTVSQIFLVPSFSSCNACGVVIGKAVGCDRIDLVKPLTKILQIFLIIMGVSMGILLFLFKGIIISFYNVSAETTALALQFMTVLSLTCMGSTYEYPVMGGIIAGGGNTKYQTVIDMSFMWLLVIPCAAVSAFVFNWPPVVTFIFLKFDQLLKCIPNSIYCNSYKWIKNRTR